MSRLDLFEMRKAVNFPYDSSAQHEKILREEEKIQRKLEVLRKIVIAGSADGVAAHTDPNMPITADGTGNLILKPEIQRKLQDAGFSSQFIRAISPSGVNNQPGANLGKLFAAFSAHKALQSYIIGTSRNLSAAHNITEQEAKKLLEEALILGSAELIKNPID